MAEVTIAINGRTYDIGCDAGQEQRILDLAAYVDERMRQVARSGAAYNDTHLMILTSILLANEVEEAMNGAAPAAPRRADPVEEPAAKPALVATKPVAAADASGEKEPAATAAETRALLKVLEGLTKRVETIARRVQDAA